MPMMKIHEQAEQLERFKNSVELQSVGKTGEDRPADTDRMYACVCYDGRGARVSRATVTAKFIAN